MHKAIPVNPETVFCIFYTYDHEKEALETQLGPNHGYFIYKYDSSQRKIINSHNGNKYKMPSKKDAIVPRHWLLDKLAQGGNVHRVFKIENGNLVKDGRWNYY